MSTVSIIAIIAFTGLLMKEIYNVSRIVLRSTLDSRDIIEMITGVAGMAVITYLYESQWYHYLFFVIACAGFICTFFKYGISRKGFISKLRKRAILYWNDIKKVNIRDLGNKIEIKLSGEFICQDFYFKKEDLDKIMDAMNEHGIEIELGE